MSMKGKRLYVCDDCKHERFEHWTIRNRAKRPQCPACGSYWYDIKTKEAKADAVDLLEYREAVKKVERPKHFYVVKHK